MIRDCLSVVCRSVVVERFGLVVVGTADIRLVSMQADQRSNPHKFQFIFKSCGSWAPLRQPGRDGGKGGGAVLFSKIPCFKHVCTILRIKGLLCHLISNINVKHKLHKAFRHTSTKFR